MGTPKVLILSPTRELARQTYDQVEQLVAHNQLKSCLIVGGVPFGMQKAMVAQTIDVLVATPGRLIEIEEHMALDLSQVTVFVIDEADRMLDLGFIQAIHQVSDLLPLERQTSMFSATLEGDNPGVEFEFHDVAMIPEGWLLAIAQDVSLLIISMPCSDMSGLSKAKPRNEYDKIN